MRTAPMLLEIMLSSLYGTLVEVLHHTHSTKKYPCFMAFIKIMLKFGHCILNLTQNPETDMISF
ncbi:hypothetical protein KFK09_002698 [Dendrobium nobile]|uniref:Uncharacterized protein n=1 Tax=Dendrobium nobile TaxID=94219 RepID=A0A8T3C729_DENNO|nr:hypothetical protein KFK09_002698 [Dendrobium nobile]